MTIPIAEPPLPGARSYNPDVHYRLFINLDGQPTTLCAQDFDYYDYDLKRILTEDEYNSENEALAALNALLAEIAGDPDFERDAIIARRIDAAGGPLTRTQALLVALARNDDLLDTSTTGAAL